MKLEKEVLHLNILKAIYKKSIPNIIVNVEKLKTFLLKSGTRRGSKMATETQKQTA
jgi:hypothetical protein